MRVSVLAGALLASALVPAAVVAQACVGMPSSDGQIAFAGSATATDGDVEPGGEFHVDVSGPASFQLGYGNGHDGGVGRSYTALGAYELYLLEPSICAVAGAFHADDIEPDIDDRSGVSAGFGIGKTLRAERFSTTVYAVPRLARFRETTVVLGTERTAYSNAFMGEAGVTVGILPFYVGGAVTLSTIGDGEPGLKLRAGLLF